MVELFKNYLRSIDWTNTLNTRKASVWWPWVKMYLLIFLLVKSWQFLSGHLLFSGKKYPDVLQKCPDITLSRPLYWTLRQSDASFYKVVRFLLCWDFLCCREFPLLFVVSSLFYCDFFLLWRLFTFILSRVLYFVDFFVLLWYVWATVILAKDNN